MTIDEFKKNIAPYMRKGWVAMDNDFGFYYYNSKPRINLEKEKWDYDNICFGLFYTFDIDPAEDWTKSLIEVGR